MNIILEGFVHDLWKVRSRENLCTFRSVKFNLFYSTPADHHLRYKRQEQHVRRVKKKQPIRSPMIRGKAANSIARNAIAKRKSYSYRANLLSE